MIDIRTFGGIIPKRDPHLLPETAAQIAANCKLWSGAIDPMRRPLLAFAPTKSGDMISMYRMDDRAGGSDFWLSWPRDVDAIRGAVVDTQQRVYYTGDYEPRVTTYEMATAGTDTQDGSDRYPASFGTSGTDYPRAFYALGVPNPILAPVVAPSGGVAADEERAYFYTFKDMWGQESGPSPATLATGKPDGTWALSKLQAAPLNTGSIVAATHSAGTVTVYTSAPNWLKAGHRIAVASVTGMTDLNTNHTVTDALNVSVNTVSRSRNANVATLVLKSVEGLEVGQTVVVAGLGGASYNATAVLTGVNATTKAITYANTAANEAVTADTGGLVQMGMFQVALTTAQVYSSGGTWKREAPWNVNGLTKRIYRTVTGAAETVYLRVDEIAAATTTYSDTVTAANLGPVFATEGYDTPPGTMIAITAMPNGMTAGAAGNEVCFAEPFKPYAWPVVYRQPVNWPIVGLGAFGQSLAVITTAIPYVATGTHPGAISMQDGDTAYPCQSKRGIQSLGWGVTYPADAGMVVLSARGIELATESFYSRKEWQESVNGGIFAASMVFEGRYYAFWTDGDSSYAYIMDAREPTAVITQGTEKAIGAWCDPESGLGYILDKNGDIMQWDADPAYRLTYQWKSAIYRAREPINYGAARIEGDFSITPAETAAIDATNATRTAANAALIAGMASAIPRRDNLWGSLGSRPLGALALAKTRLADLLSSEPQFITFQLIASNDDGTEVVRYSTTLTKQGTFRLPGGYMSDKHVVNLVGNVRTTRCLVGPTADLLRKR